MGQFFKKCLDRRQIGDVDPDVGWPHRTRFETHPNSRDVCVASAIRHGEPDRDDNERHQTQLRPGKPKELNHDQHEDRPDTTGNSVDRDVDKGLSAKSDLI